VQAQIALFVAVAPIATARTALAQKSETNTVPVTVTNLSAETDMYFANMAKQRSFGKFAHRREPANIDKQDIVRMNRDTLYSLAVFDLDAGPVTIVMPDAAKRFMSLMIIDEDHYVPAVFYGAGRTPSQGTKSARATSTREFVHWSILKTQKMWSRSTRFKTQSSPIRKALGHSRCRTGTKPAKRRFATRFSSSTEHSPTSRMRSAPRARSIRLCI
jgi:hypothetical protein